MSQSPIIESVGETRILPYAVERLSENNFLVTGYFGGWAFLSLSELRLLREESIHGAEGLYKKLLQSGIIINAKGEIISSLCKSPSASLDEYQPCPKSTSHELLQKRLLSLMGTADYIFEGNRIMSHQNSSSLTKANQ